MDNHLTNSAIETINRQSKIIRQLTPPLQNSSYGLLTEVAKQSLAAQNFLDSMEEAKIKLEEILSRLTFTSIYPDNISEEEQEEIQEVDSKIISEIYSDTSSQQEDDNTGLITLSPINDKVLKYLSENPEAWYQLTDSDFELAMAEIYNKLGYKVERTQTTRDGGKDIIIRKPEILGDFIYYVECKKYAPKRPIGVGIMRNLVGTINTDRVNGGILATTSYFTKPARDFILNNNLSYQIKTHDYNTIQQLLNTVV